MNILDESQTFTDSKELPKEYLILKLRLQLNKELYQMKVITYEIFEKMQKLLFQRMDKIIIENKKISEIKKEKK